MRGFAGDFFQRVLRVSNVVPHLRSDGTLLAAHRLKVDWRARSGWRAGQSDRGDAPPWVERFADRGALRVFACSHLPRPICRTRRRGGRVVEGARLLSEYMV